MSQSAANPWLDFDGLVAAGFPLRTAATDDVIFNYGDSGDGLFVVRSGRVKLVRYGTLLETAAAGAIFGEMSLIDSSPRSATATAIEPCELAVVDRNAFHYLVRQNPDFALDLMRRLADRIRRMNESL